MNPRNQMNNFASNEDNTPFISQSDINHPITGFGDNQEVRIYVENQSSTYNNNNGIFNVAAPDTNTFLDYGEYLFDLQNNYTTEHILEDDDALNLPSDEYIKFLYREVGSSLILNNGTDDSGTFSDIYNTGNSTYKELSTSNGIIDFDIIANFSGTNTNTGGTYGVINFDREFILGIFIIFTQNLSASANLTISAFNQYTSEWKTIDFVELNSGMQKINLKTINDNLNLINLSDCSKINFHYNSSIQNTYSLSLHELIIQSTYSFSLDISDSHKIALEFDIRGDDTLINGFYAWIRTLNLTEAKNTKLNLSIYTSTANLTDRTSATLISESYDPDIIIPQYSITLENYTGDKPIYFNFSTNHRINMGNYFLVIETNNSANVYSLVTLPTQLYGDDKNEHQLKEYVGGNWNLATKSIGGALTPPLDSNNFKLNISRGYFPSDFLLNSNKTLVIQDIPLNNSRGSFYPYTYGYEWGLAIWETTHPQPITNGGTANYQIQLYWNKTITNDFYFNVTYYAKAYGKANSTVQFQALYDENPQWSYNYTLDLQSNPLLLTWTFTEFWFIYPNYLDNQTLTGPPNYNTNKLSETEGETIFTENTVYDKLVITNSILNNVSGNYILNLTSYNAIDKVFSYLDYYDNTWENQGFMWGDNMTISVDVKGINDVIPSTGSVNATLYYPNGSVYLKDYDISGTISSTKKRLEFDFNNDIFLQITDQIPIYGKYHLGMFWENGSAIGYKKIPIYIDYYNISLANIEYVRESQENRIDLNILRKSYKDYYLSVASINRTTEFAQDFYSISALEINQAYLYEKLGYDLYLQLNSFMQNESILNPGEDIRFKVNLKNLDEIFDLNVKITINLVSYINEDWVIANGTSTTQVLSQNGEASGTDSKDFFVDLTLPSIKSNGLWPGVNAPIRKGGAKAILKIYIDDIEIGTYESSKYALLVNQTEDLFEGHILELNGPVLTSAPFAHIAYLKRENFLYAPENTTILINVIDEHSISSYQQFDSEFELTEDSKFVNTSINPETPINGKTFTINSTLTSEFGTPLIGKTVTSQYLNDTNWVDIDTKITDSEGNFIFNIDTNLITISSNTLKIRLKWDGETYYLNNSKILTIDFYEYNNSIDLSGSIQGTVIYRNFYTLLSITISNQGNSVLNISNISLNFNQGSLNYELVQNNQIILSNFQAQTTTKVVFQIFVPNLPGDLLNITISVEAQNIDTKEIISQTKSVAYSVINRPIADILTDFIFLIVLGIIGVIWIVSILYILRLKKTIETPEEAKARRKPKKGKYVKVSEIPKKESETTKTTDLDSLLEEEGLED